MVRREGGWEQWLDFFLEGAEHTAVNAVQTARCLLELFEEDEVRIQGLGHSAGNALRVFRALSHNPAMPSTTASKQVHRNIVKAEYRGRSNRPEAQPHLRLRVLHSSPERRAEPL